MILNRRKSLKIKKISIFFHKTPSFFSEIILIRSLLPDQRPKLINDLHSLDIASYKIFVSTRRKITFSSSGQSS
jgi:hypothetical protein